MEKANRIKGLTTFLERPVNIEIAAGLAGAGGRRRSESLAGQIDHENFFSGATTLRLWPVPKNPARPRPRPPGHARAGAATLPTQPVPKIRRAAEKSRRETPGKPKQQFALCLDTGRCTKCGFRLSSESSGEDVRRVF